MTEEQNDVDLCRMATKRVDALSLLDDFSKWYGFDTIGKTGDPAKNLVIIGLTRDILRGTETEVDDMIDHLTERCEQALMKKLETTI